MPPASARWIALPVALSGATLIVAWEMGCPVLLIGAMCVIWSTFAAWTCGSMWTAGLWTIGLAIASWRAWPVSPMQIRDAGGLSLAALLAAISAERIGRRLDREYRQARLDHLTGLPNRQAFIERCHAELSRSRRFQRPLTLILLDGDRFKQVNDRHGHPAGDRALQGCARSLRDATRQYDLIARLGGDEFIVVLPETNSADAERVAQRLQATLAADVATAFAPLSFSLGVATFYPGSWDVDDCLSHVDRLLYAAKQSGRGQIQAETLIENVKAE
jgi:diguanylate cyclase (GGDEF)-like protein